MRKVLCWKIYKNDDFVLRDGSMTLFAARLNSGLTKQLLGYQLFPDASITVTDWDFIPHKHGNDEPCENCLVMFIKGFYWTAAPSMESVGNPKLLKLEEITKENFQKAQFDVVEDVRKSKCVFHYNYCMTGKWRCSSLSIKGIENGHWMRNPDTVFVGRRFQLIKCASKTILPRHIN